MEQINTDTRFWLLTFNNGKAQNTSEYKNFQSQIQINGYQIMNAVKVYTPELALILFSNEISVINMDDAEQITLNCFPYIETYVQGFNEGIKYFDREFGIPPVTLYGANAEQYVNDLHANYYHTGKAPNDGWKYVKETFPLTLTHAAVGEYGYYSGIVSKVEEILIKYPQLFQNFDKCEKSSIHPDNRLVAIYINARQRLKSLPKSLSKPEVINVFKEISSDSKYGVIRKEMSSNFNPKVWKTYLEDNVPNYKGILSSLPEGKSVLKLINDSHKKQN